MNVSQLTSFISFRVFITLLLLTALIQVAYAAPKSTGGGAEQLVEYRFVGATTKTYWGAISFDVYTGYTAMDKACEAEFGEGARAASIEEARNLIPGVESLKIQAWLAPGNSPIIVTTNSNGGYRPFDSASGFAVGRGSADDQTAALEGSYCAQYDSGDPSASALGPILDGGSISLGVCTDFYKIACSAPFAIPVRPFPSR